MTDLTLTGFIKKIFSAEQVTATFEKREFVLETDEAYPQTFKIETTKDNIAKLDNFAEGDAVTVSYNLRGREWQKDEKTFYFITLQAWRIELNKAAVADIPPPPPATIDNNFTDQDGDGLPF